MYLEKLKRLKIWNRGSNDLLPVVRIKEDQTSSDSEDTRPLNS